MSGAPPRRRTPTLHKSLCVLLPALYGKIITVELKDNTEVTGTLADASVAMSMTLMAARLVSFDGKVTDLEIVFVKGTTVRFIHIPQEINPVKALANALERRDRIFRRGDKSKKPRRTIEDKTADLESTDDEKNDGEQEERRGDDIL